MLFESPINQTSIGQSAFCIVREFLNNGEDLALRPMEASIALNSFNISNDLAKSVNSALEKGKNANFSSSEAGLKYFHISGATHFISRKRNLFTFHETDRLTPTEVNILNNCDNVFFSCQYSCEIARAQLNRSVNVIYAPLGFDSESFKIVKNPNKRKDVTVFSLKGKFEKRKHTARIIKSWTKIFGGHPNYRLDCLVHNPFMTQGEWDLALREIFKNSAKPWNVNFIPYLPSNSQYNLALNEADVDLTGMSGGEGFNLPLFQSLCLGKQAIVLNAHAHKDFCTSENSFLIEPSGKIDSEDGKFFKNGAPFNQGNFFDYKDSDFEDALLSIVDRAKTENIEGIKLAKEFNYSRTCEILKSVI